MKTWELKKSFYQSIALKNPKKNLSTIYNDLVMPLMSPQFKDKIIYLLSEIKSKDNSSVNFIGKTEDVFIEMVKQFGPEMKEGKTIGDEFLFKAINILEGGIQFYILDWNIIGEKLERELYQLFTLYVASATGLLND